MSLHTQAETARHLVEEKHAHYLMIIKANQPSLPEAVTNALAGTDADFTGTSWTEEGKGHGRREKRRTRHVQHHNRTAAHRGGAHRRGQLPLARSWFEVRRRD